MSGKRKIIVKAGKKVKQLISKAKTRRANMNSTDNMSNTGPVDKAIKKTEKIRDNYKHEHTLRYENYADQYDKPIGMSKKDFYPYAPDIQKGVTKADNLLNKLSFKRLGKKMGIKWA